MMMRERRTMTFLTIAVECCVGWISNHIKNKKNRRTVASELPGKEPGNPAALVTARGAIFLWKIRVTREFDIGKTHAARRQLICANGGRGLVTNAARRRDDVILIDAVTADADCANQHTVFKER